MIHPTRRSFVAGMLATLIVIPLQPAQACPGAQLHAQIVFDSAPYHMPPGLVAKNFHLTNQVPDFEQWRLPRDFSFKEKNIEMRHFSFIGIGASFNPWTHWFTSSMPEWLVAKPKYMPIFAPTSSCTGRFRPFEHKIDQTLLLVGKILTMTNGEPAFAAASFRDYDNQWETYNSRIGSF